jgi:hypothetical protein
VELFFLISAGHESRRDWKLLLSVSPPAESFRLLLWEKVLQVWAETEYGQTLIGAIRNIPDYFLPQDAYMHGIDS